MQGRGATSILERQLPAGARLGNAELAGKDLFEHRRLAMRCPAPAVVKHPPLAHPALRDPRPLRHISAARYLSEGFIDTARAPPFPVRRCAARTDPGGAATPD
jgi:hypothetical protein